MQGGSALVVAENIALPPLTTKTGRSYSKRYLAQQWEKTCKAAGIVDLHFHDIRGTTVTMLAEAGCTLPEIVSITGHTLRVSTALAKSDIRYLDLLGNRNGKFDVGDFLAWVKETGATPTSQRVATLPAAPRVVTVAKRGEQ